MGGHAPSPWGRVSCLPATRSRSSPSRHGEGQEGGPLAQKAVRLGVGEGQLGGEGWWWLRGGYAAQGREMDEKWGKMGVISLGEGSNGTKWGHQYCLTKYALFYSVRAVGRLFFISSS